MDIDGTTNRNMVARSRPVQNNNGGATSLLPRWSVGLYHPRHGTPTFVEGAVPTSTSSSRGMYVRPYLTSPDLDDRARLD